MPGCERTRAAMWPACARRWPVTRRGLRSMGRARPARAVVDRREALVADDRQQGEALGVLGARGGGEDDELLRLVLGCQDLAVEVDDTDRGMGDALARLGGQRNLVLVPQ